jgi:hypothetical protein
MFFFLFLYSLNKSISAKTLLKVSFFFYKAVMLMRQSKIDKTLWWNAGALMLFDCMSK